MEHMRTLSYRDRIRKLERRRRAAGQMFDKGKTQSDVARHFHVSRAAACQWHAQWKEDKKKGLLSKGRSGATPKLDAQQKQALKRMILSGPAKSGYATDFWTLERIRAVARKKIGVTLGTTSVWRTVIGLGFSVQKPERRARERNEKAIMDWKLNTFPKLKKIC